MSTVKIPDGHPSFDKLTLKDTKLVGTTVFPNGAKIQIGNNPSSGTIATTAFVNRRIGELTANAPETLNSLKELATSLGGEVNLKSYVDGKLDLKANKDGSNLTGISNIGGKTITLEGDLTHAGGHTQTFTSTGPTNVNLPLEGTLATKEGTETLQNKTLTAPKIDLISDGNGNELVVFGQTANAVNEIKISNAATNNGPTIAAHSAGDTNVDLNISAQGAGNVQINSNVIIVAGKTLAGNITGNADTASGPQIGSTLESFISLSQEAFKSAAVAYTATGALYRTANDEDNAKLYYKAAGDAYTAAGDNAAAQDSYASAGEEALFEIATTSATAPAALAGLAVTLKKSTASPPLSSNTTINDQITTKLNRISRIIRNLITNNDIDSVIVGYKEIATINLDIANICLAAGEKIAAVKYYILAAIAYTNTADKYLVRHNAGLLLDELLDYFGDPDTASNYNSAGDSYILAADNNISLGDYTNAAITRAAAAGCYLIAAKRYMYYTQHVADNYPPITKAEDNQRAINLFFKSALYYKLAGDSEKIAAIAHEADVDRYTNPTGWQVAVADNPKWAKIAKIKAAAAYNNAGKYYNYSGAGYVLAYNRGPDGNGGVFVFNTTMPSPEAKVSYEEAAEAYRNAKRMYLLYDNILETYPIDFKIRIASSNAAKNTQP